MKLIDVTDATFENSVIHNEKPVLVEFWAPWCGPCRMLAPAIERLAVELGGDLSVQKLDVDDNENTAQRYGIRAIPSVILFSQGTEQDRVVGNLPHEDLFRRVQSIVYQEEFQQKPEFEFAALTVIDGIVRLVSLLPDGTYKFLDNTDKFHNILYAYNLDGFALKYAVEEFEEMINDTGATEQDFHDFFEKHPEFIINDEYKQAHSKIVLERDDEGPLIPDFVLEPFSKNGLCDLLELKTPLANTYVMKKNRVRFSSAVMEAVAQLREYSLYFDEKQYRERLEGRYGLIAYKPRMYVILGRTGKVNSIQARNVQLDIPGVTIKSYDDVLDRMKRKVGK